MFAVVIARQTEITLRTAFVHQSLLASRGRASLQFNGGGQGRYCAILGELARPQRSLTLKRSTRASQAKTMTTVSRPTVRRGKGSACTRARLRAGTPATRSTMTDCFCQLTWEQIPSSFKRDTRCREAQRALELVQAFFELNRRHWKLGTDAQPISLPQSRRALRTDADYPHTRKRH